MENSVVSDHKIVYLVIEQGRVYRHIIQGTLLLHNYLQPEKQWLISSLAIVLVLCYLSDINMLFSRRMNYEFNVRQQNT